MYICASLSFKQSGTLEASLIQKNSFLCLFNSLLARPFTMMRLMFFITRFLHVSVLYNSQASSSPGDKKSITAISSDNFSSTRDPLLSSEKHIYD
jgi:hypothetical protein